MNNTQNRIRIKHRIPMNRNPIKLTALLYLREALLDERYEECAEFIAIAGEFGANPNAIRNLLEDPRRLPGP